ncbi:hypothetical protein [uncultured Tateyamaria sp.]|uniref:hypothetical protein n=1 Tax=uncultured Tateyamaria sp. TaxID=455651 RepID=UPI002608ED03|nr:hypothetical protein [uncultured Tateyamaria sp.]
MRRLAHILSFLATLLLAMPGPNTALAVPMAVSDASFAPMPPHSSTRSAQLTSSARAPPISRILAHPEHDRVDGFGSPQFTLSGLQIAELGRMFQQTNARANCNAFMAASLEYGVEAGIAWGVGAAIPGDKTVMAVLGWVIRRGGDEVKRAVDTVVETAAGVATNRTGSAVAGVYGNTRPMTDEFPELAVVNPHYVDGAGPWVNTNCVSCVNATVDRMTGRNPSAVAGQSK